MAYIRNMPDRASFKFYDTLIVHYKRGVVPNGDTITVGIQFPDSDSPNNVTWFDADVLEYLISALEDIKNIHKEINKP